MGSVDKARVRGSDASIQQDRALFPLHIGCYFYSGDIGITNAMAI